MGNQESTRPNIPMISDQPIKVQIEYCNRWGFEARAMKLQEYIIQAYPNAEVHMFVGRKSSFEVTVNDKLVHSYLNQEGQITDYDSFFAKLKQITQGWWPYKKLWNLMMVNR